MEALCQSCESSPFDFKYPLHMSPAHMELYKKHVMVDAGKRRDLIHNGELLGEAFKRYRCQRLTVKQATEVNFDKPQNLRNYFAHRFARCGAYKPNRRLTTGEVAEQPALQWLNRRYGYQINKPKLVVNPNIPWLVASIDGLATLHGETYGVEVKYVLERLSDPRWKTLYFGSIYRDGNILRIKHWSKIYIQVQLYMAITNLHKWIVVIRFKDGHRKLQVNFDVNFTRNLLCKAYAVYFEHFWPMLVNKL